LGLSTSLGEDGVQVAVGDIARREGFGQETESDAKDGQPSRLLQMFREAGDLGAEAMSLSDRRN